VRGRLHIRRAPRSASRQQHRVPDRPPLLALRIGYVRDEIAWNALLIPYEHARLTTWLAEAYADHLTPLITFDHAGGTLRHVLPSSRASALCSSVSAASTRG